MNDGPGMAIPAREWRLTHVWSAAWADIMRNGMRPEAAAKAFSQIEAIFAKYPIAQG
jgi:hypothetical protein